MSDVIGHWNSLAEAQKLTESVLVSGIIEETMEVGGLLERLPAVQVKGESIKWNREKTLPSGELTTTGTQLAWKSNVEYDQQEETLKQVYMQRVLNNYIAEVYGTINNYEAILLMEMKKGNLRTVEDYNVYGDKTNGDALEWDGLHAIVQNATGDLNIDEGAGPLSLYNLRKMMDAMKYGCDILLMPHVLARRIDASLQEAGIASWVGMGSVVWGKNELGQRVTYFDGVPIIRSDYLVAEQSTTGLTTTSKRAKRTSGVNQYSIFGIKFGDVIAGQPGLCLGFGNTREVGEFFKFDRFDKLEDYDAAGLRLVAYCCLMLGSSKCLARIADVTDAAVTV